VASGGSPIGNTTRGGRMTASAQCQHVPSFLRWRCTFSLHVSGNRLRNTAVSSLRGRKQTRGPHPRGSWNGALVWLRLADQEHAR
jgi:hypothetical protein